MENRTDTSGSHEPDEYNAGLRWHEAVDVLRMVQSDYGAARKQLEGISYTLHEREALINQRLHYAMLASGGYRTLCLVSCAEGTSTSQVGKTVLGKVGAPSALPKLVSLKVRCLGRFEARCEWNQVERWQSVKAKSVFQYLMTKPREPIIKDTLMEALWPDCDTQAASNNLKAAVHSLRQSLNSLFDGQGGYPYILFLQGHYRMNPEVELWIDVEEFEQHWTTGRRLEKDGKVLEAISEFEKAEALYRGDYLEDEPYEEWTLLRRESLKDIYLIILGKLADHSMDTADYESSIVHCQKVLTKDPCREDAYRRLMRCYSRLGYRNRALYWYEICRQTIQAEVDTIPDRQTMALYQQLLRNEPI